MNVALVHDRLQIKSFWEERINIDGQHAESEERRRNKSSLKKLRDEWTVRLEKRNKNLKLFNDSYVKKLKAAAT
ncbi:protein FAM240B [Odontesthes bonariensis]|uniref:protein FAM240B n=1 Tax=Odontesthes bonariensis TaxID=219752 RepID=UPI003F586CC8